MGQEERKIKDAISKDIQTYGNNKSNTQIIEDSIISNIAEYVNSNEIFKNKNEKDLIRHYLNGKRIYDKKFEIFNIKIRNIDDLNLTSILKKSDELKSSIDDCEFNSFGVNIIKKGSIYRVQIILTKSYIEFKEISYKISHPNPLEKDLKIPPRLIIKGISKIPVIYYYKGKETNDKEEQIAVKKEEVVLNIDKSFELDFEYNNEDILFYDDKGNIIAHLSNLMN